MLVSTGARNAVRAGARLNLQRLRYSSRKKPQHKSYWGHFASKSRNSELIASCEFHFPGSTSRTGSRAEVAEGGRSIGVGGE